jgi:hypothetical protein
MLISRLEQSKVTRDFKFIKKTSDGSRRQSRSSLNSSCSQICYEPEIQSQNTSQHTHVRRRSYASAEKPKENVGYTYLSSKKRQLSRVIAEQDSRTARQLELKKGQRSYVIEYAQSASSPIDSLASPKPSMMMAQDSSVLRRDFKKAYYNSAELIEVRRRQMAMSRL